MHDHVWVWDLQASVWLHLKSGAAFHEYLETSGHLPWCLVKAQTLGAQVQINPICSFVAPKVSIPYIYLEPQGKTGKTKLFCSHSGHLLP